MPRIIYRAGIDYSITSPCVAVGPQTPLPSFEDCQFLVINDHPPKDLSRFPNIQVLPHVKEYLYDIERFIHNAELITRFCRHHNVMDAVIEDYAMGARGRIFNIGENGGVLKYKLFKNRITFNCISPTSIKKFATGKGNAKKDQMWEQFVKDTGREDLYTAMIGTRKLDSPLTDIVDAYYILRYH